MLRKSPKEWMDFLSEQQTILIGLIRFHNSLKQIESVIFNPSHCSCQTGQIHKNLHKICNPTWCIVVLSKDSSMPSNSQK